MKFLCDNCKAKYQIADDKVAGKTVRMKCRKCGHLIEIRASAALAEATAFRSLPAEELSRIMEEPAKPTTAPPAAAPAPRPAAGAAPKPAAAPSAGARKPAGAPAPRPAAGAGASVRSLGATATKGATALARAPEPEPAEEKSPSAGGLASAFSQSVGGEADDNAASSSFDMGAGTADEWYSGINGVPVGPMRLSELRSKIAAGLVTEESLVWREGFEEWVALRTVPALVEMARSSLPGERLSPAARKGSSIRTGPAAGNVVSIRPEASKSDPRVAAAAAAAPADEPHDDATNIFSGAALGAAMAQADAAAAAAASAPAVEAPVEPAAPAAAVSVSDPFAAPAPLFAATPAATASATPAAASFEPVLPAAAAEPARPPSNRIPPMAWVVVGLALAVGVVGGTMLVPKPAPEITVQTVVVEKAVQAPTPDVTAKSPSDAIDPSADPSASAKKVVVGPGPGPRTNPTSVAPTASVAALPALPALPNAGGGASPLPGNTAAPPSSTETIPAGKLQEIVNGQRSSLRRVCWDPLVASGAVAGSVKASVNLTIVNGQVTSVSVSGGDARMSSCVQTRVRGWQFPTGFAPTTTSFVLAFVAQAQ